MFNTLKTLTAAAALLANVSAAQAQQVVMVPHSAAADQAANAALDCFIAERPNTPAPFEDPRLGHRHWTRLIVRCERQTQQWVALCKADGNPAQFCIGKSMRLAQLIYSGHMVCDATNCRIDPGFTTNVDRNGN